MGRINLERALAALDRGGIVALPTESSFALATRLDRAAGFDALEKIKHGRRKPIALMAASTEMVEQWVRPLHAWERRFADRFWPGPLTLVLGGAKVSELPPSVVGERGVGVRVPGLEPLCDLLERVGVPVTATSANRPGEAPLTTVRALIEAFPEIPVWDVLEACSGGMPSTVAVVSEEGTVTVLREGAIAGADLGT